MDKVAAELHQACRDVGFFMVKGHGKHSTMCEANLDQSANLTIDVER